MSDDGEHDKALDLIKDQRIFRVKGSDDMFIVTGQNDEYLVMSDFCTCDHFTIRCLKEPGKVCYHILAVNMASKIDKELEIDWTGILTREH